MCFKGGGGTYKVVAWFDFVLFRPTCELSRDFFENLSLKLCVDVDVDVDVGLCCATVVLCFDTIVSSKSGPT